MGQILHYTQLLETRQYLTKASFRVDSQVLESHHSLMGPTIEILVSIQNLKELLANLA